MREILGEEERDRRDPERKSKQAESHRERDTKRRRADGSVNRTTYVGQAKTDFELVIELAKQGIKGPQIATKVNKATGTIRNMITKARKQGLL